MSIPNLLMPGGQAGVWNTKRSAYIASLDLRDYSASYRDQRLERERPISIINREATLTAIDELLQGEEAQDNWDGLGAKALLKETVEVAKKFISILSYKIPAPDVSVMEDGSVCFMWMGVKRGTFISKITPAKRLVYGMSAADNRQTSGEPLFEGEAVANIVADIEVDLTTHIFPELAETYADRSRQQA